MHRRLSRTTRAVVLATSFAGVAVHGQGPMSSTGAGASAPAAAASANAPFEVDKLFATTCGWCHSGGGRVAGKGPKLMDSTLTDAEIVYRIKNGKAGQMPAFGSAFTDEQIKAIVAYIRNLKPEGKA